MNPTKCTAYICRRSKHLSSLVFEGNKVLDAFGKGLSDARVNERRGVRIAACVMRPIRSMSSMSVQQSRHPGRFSSALAMVGEDVPIEISKRGIFDLAEWLDPVTGDIHNRR